jgi:hypothetical protein
VTHGGDPCRVTYVNRHLTTKVPIARPACRTTTLLFVYRARLIVSRGPVTKDTRALGSVCATVGGLEVHAVSAFHSILAAAAFRVSATVVAAMQQFKEMGVVIVIQVSLELHATCAPKTISEATALRVQDV